MQTCSPRCRVRVYRRRQAEAWAAREAAVRPHAEAIIWLLDGLRVP